MRDLGRSRALCSMALWAVSSFLACSREELRGAPDAANTGTGPEPTTFIDRYTQLYCDSIGPCCIAAGHGHDAEACKARLDSSAILGAIELGVPYSKDAAAQCLEELAGWFDACPMTWPLSCSRVLVGSEPPGGNCFTSYQCVPPDDGLTLCIGGQCNTVRYLVEGARCGGNTIDFTPGVFEYEICAPPHYCDAQGTCRLPPVPGEPCDSMYIYSCRIDAYCSAAGSPTCESRVAPGLSCTSASCTRDAYCDESICSPLKTADAVCADDRECFSMQCVNGVCLGGSAILVPFSLQCIQ